MPNVAANQALTDLLYAPLAQPARKSIPPTERTSQREDTTSFSEYLSDKKADRQEKRERADTVQKEEAPTPKTVSEAKQAEADDHNENGDASTSDESKSVETRAAPKNEKEEPEGKSAESERGDAKPATPSVATLEAAPEDAPVIELTAVKAADEAVVSSELAGAPRETSPVPGEALPQDKKTSEPIIADVEDEAAEVAKEVGSVAAPIESPRVPAQAEASPSLAVDTPEIEAGDGETLVAGDTSSPNVAPAPVSAPTDNAAAEQVLVAATTGTKAQASQAKPGGTKSDSAKSDKSSDAGSAGGKPSTADMKAAEPATAAAAQTSEKAVRAPGAEAPKPMFAPLVTDSAAMPLHQTTEQSGLGLTTVSANAPGQVVLKAQMHGARPQLPTPEIALQIVRQFEAGSSRFEIRLDPPELGRIDVRLEIGDDGAVRAHLTADRPETLDLLQRDAKALERALQGLGLDTDADTLGFSLRQDGGKGRQAEGESGQRGSTLASVDESDATTSISRQSDVPNSLRLNIVI